MGLGEAGKWLVVALGVAACGGESRSISSIDAVAGAQMGGAAGTDASGGTGAAETGGAGASGGTGGGETGGTGAAETGGVGGAVTAGSGAGPAGNGGASAGAGGSGGDLIQPIDDMEGNEDHGLSPGSFYWGPAVGFWFYSTIDVTGDAIIEEIAPPRGESTRACRIEGEDLVEGMDLWAQLDHPFNRTFDLGGYAGITFWAKLESPSGRLVVALMNGLPYFGAVAEMAEIQSVTLDASAEWQEFVIPFEDFGDGVSSASSIDFIAGIGGEPFDLWIDDLAFFCDGPCVEPG